MAEITRRDFVEGGVAAGFAGVLATGMTVGTAAQAKEVKEVVEEGEVDNILPVKAPATWDGEYDIVIVGSGGAGLLAAVKAAKEGAKVTLIEKMDTVGGAAQYSTAAGAYGTYVQKEKAGFDITNLATHDEFYNILWERMNYTIEGSVMESIMMNSGEALNWMHNELGINWDIRYDDPYNIEFRYHTPEGKMSLRHIGVMGFVTDELYAQGQQAGVDYRLLTTAKALVEDGGRIAGIKAEVDGKEIYLRAGKGVILCGGGMANNRAMLAKYVPTALKACGACYDMFGMGDVIRMGWGAGADIAGYDSFDAFDGGIPYFEKGLGNWYHFLYNGDICLARQPWLFVNKYSNRFSIIQTAQLFYRPRIIGAQPDYTAYVIFDSKYRDNIFAFGERGCRQPVTPDDPDIDRYADVLDSTDWTITVDKAIECGVIKKADTIEELAELLDLNPEKLPMTVERYNGYCADGVDPEFNKPKELLVPVSEPPFYGIEVRGLLASTDCGLRVNGKYEVLNTEGNPIPGLYAAGHTAGGGSGEFTFAHSTFTSNMGYVYASGFAAVNSVLEA